MKQEPPCKIPPPGPAEGRIPLVEATASCARKGKKTPAHKTAKVDAPAVKFDIEYDEQQRDKVLHRYVPILIHLVILRQVVKSGRDTASPRKQRTTDSSQVPEVSSLGRMAVDTKVCVTYYKG